ncbi:MAG: hypothetical protein N2C14_01400 [Planctomycetales bacterium]
MVRLPRISIAFSFVLLATAAASVGFAEKKTRLFILSGQSNMVGLNPNVSFTPAVTKAFSGDKIIVVKDAAGGQPIRRWFKQWKPADAGKSQGKNAGKEKYGDLYDRLMSKVAAASKGKKFDSISFVWMQGERDAKEGHGAVYAASMKGLIEQLRGDLKRPDMTVVIGRLSDHLKDNKGWEAVRAAQVQVAEGDKAADWIDTDELNGPRDGLHYPKEGYAEMGKRFAAKTIALVNKPDK